MNMRRFVLLALASAILVSAIPGFAQYDQALFSGMKWRQIGPFRGGRVLAVTGIPGDPTTYYFGAVAGGVWKSTNGGVSWTPLFDKQPISSIGAIGVAESQQSLARGHEHGGVVALPAFGGSHIGSRIIVAMQMRGGVLRVQVRVTQPRMAA